MNNTKRIIALIAGMFFCVLNLQAGARDSVPVNVIEANVSPVVERLPLTGTITSERSAALSSRVSGLVEKLNVDAGDRVKQGDILLEQDRALAELALKRAHASLNEARVALKEAERLRNEAVNLAKSKNIPQTTVEARIAEVEKQAAAVATLEAEYHQQEEILRRHSVIAPFSGAVSRKLTEVGEWVETGTPVLELVATDQLRLDVQVPQEYFHLINEDTQVQISLDAARGQPFDGKVFATVPVNDPSVRTFLARVLVENAGHLIIPGMSAKAVFTINLQQEALTLPRDATVQHPDGRNSVWIVREENGKLIASEKQVRLGRSFSDRVIVREGLQPGSTVVIRGNETLTEGQAVHILDSAQAGMN